MPSDHLRFDTEVCFAHSELCKKYIYVNLGELRSQKLH